MSDPRTWTPSRGVRPEPRPTADMLEMLGLRSKDLARELAPEIRRAMPWWTEWLKLVTVLVVVCGGFAAAIIKWNRAVSDTDLAKATSAIARSAEVRARELELDLLRAERDAATHKAAVAAMRTEFDLRLRALEQPRTRRK